MWNVSKLFINAFILLYIVNKTFIKGAGLESFVEISIFHVTWMFADWCLGENETQSECNLLQKILLSCDKLHVRTHDSKAFHCKIPFSSVVQSK